MAMIYCKECGAKYSDKAIACPKCGYSEHVAHNKSAVAYVFLTLILWWCGAHKFYAGKNGQGVAMLLMTIVGWILLLPPVIAFIWALIDLIVGVCNLNTPENIFKK